MIKNLLILIFIVIGGVVVYAYYSENNPNWALIEAEIASSSKEAIVVEAVTEEKEVLPVTQSVEQEKEVEVVKKVTWHQTEFVDLFDGKSFKVNDFLGQHVLLDGFAVWNSSSLEQERELSQLQVGNTVIVSLNTDTNEKEESIREYASENDFSWRFVDLSQELIDELVTEFGFAFVNAPSAPVIHVCPNGKASLLATGVKTAQELAEAVALACE